MSASHGTVEYIVDTVVFYPFVSYFNILFMDTIAYAINLFSLNIWYEKPNKI